MVILVEVLVLKSTGDSESPETLEVSLGHMEHFPDGPSAWPAGLPGHQILEVLLSLSPYSSGG